MDKLFITGGSGLLGSNIAIMTAPIYDVYISYNNNKVDMPNATVLQIDLTEKEQLAKIKQIKPHLIIHCAGWTDVDYCQNNPEEACRQNVQASINVAEIASEIGAYLIYISSDSVFDGTEGDYKENHKTKPVNVYGKTKLEAEEKILTIHYNSCVVRTNIYGWNKREKFSLAEWMLNKLAINEELPSFKDIFFSPILVNDLVDALIELYKKSYEGIVHIAANDSCSKLDFAYMIAEIFGFDRELIKPISIDELSLAAPRGKNISLNVSKAEKILARSLPKVEEGLRKMKSLRENGYVEELKCG